MDKYVIFVNYANLLCQRAYVNLSLECAIKNAFPLNITTSWVVKYPSNTKCRYEAFHSF